MRNFFMIDDFQIAKCYLRVQKTRFIESHNVLPKYFLVQIILFSSKIRIIVRPLVALYDVFSHFFSKHTHFYQ